MGIDGARVLRPATFGRPTDEIEALQESVRDTMRRVSLTGDLPALSQVVSAALWALRRQATDMGEVCQMVERDVGIAARLVRFSNSVVFGRRRACRTLLEAVTTVGARRLEELLLAVSVRNLYVGESAVAQELWGHAFTTAIAAEDLAATVGGFERGSVFLPGLFHDVGRILFHTADPVTYEIMQGSLGDGAGDRRDLERDLLGFDHAAAGGTLAHDWGLAIESWQAVHFHHDPENAPPDAARLATLLEAADRIAHRVDDPHGMPDEEPAPLGLDPADEQTCAARVSEALASQGDLLQ